MKKAPLVSIIIPTFNCEKNLEVALRSIKRQSYKNIEIVVIDQGSADGTANTALKFGSVVRRVNKPNFYSPPSKSRNIGAKIAKGEILYHLDSDMEMPPNLISSIVKLFIKYDNVGACVVHETDVVNNYWGKCKALERRCYWGNNEIESARVVRKDVFKSVNGYDEHISTGEDFDIHRKYSRVCRIATSQISIFHHVEDCTFLKLVLKKYNYGKTAGKFFNKVNIPWYRLVSIEFYSYLKNYRLLAKTPLVALGMIILKVSELFLGLCGMLLKKS